MSFYTYRRELTEAENVADMETFLEYHYDTYQGLLQRNDAIRQIQ